MLLGISDEAAALDLFFSHLELRFDEANDSSHRLQERPEDWQDQCERDERHIYGNEVHRGTNVFKLQVTSIQSFNRDDSFVVSKFPVELIVSDINRVDFSRTLLEDTVSEPASRHTDVQTNPPVTSNANTSSAFSSFNPPRGRRVEE